MKDEEKIVEIFTIGKSRGGVEESHIYKTSDSTKRTRIKKSA